MGCPLTPASREAFLLTQSAVNAAQPRRRIGRTDRRDADVDADMNADVDAADGRDENDEWDLVADTAVFHAGGLLWSARATAIASRAVSRYAARCLVPSAAFREEGGADADADVDADVDAGEKAEKASEKAGRARALAAAVRAEAAAGAASLKRGESPGGESPRGEGDLIGGSSFDDVPIAASEWSVAPDGFLRRSAAAGEAVEGGRTGRSRGGARLTTRTPSRSYAGRVSFGATVSHRAYGRAYTSCPFGWARARSRCPCASRGARR